MTPLPSNGPGHCPTPPERIVKRSSATRSVTLKHCPGEFQELPAYFESKFIEPIFAKRRRCTVGYSNVDHHIGRPISVLWNGSSVSITSGGCVLTSHLKNR